jgi:hypothetical protein
LKYDLRRSLKLYSAFLKTTHINRERDADKSAEKVTQIAQQVVQGISRYRQQQWLQQQTDQQGVCRRVGIKQVT